MPRTKRQNILIQEPAASHVDVGNLVLGLINLKNAAPVDLGLVINRATAHVIRSALDIVAGSHGTSKNGFLGIAGRVSYPTAAFPEDIIDKVASEIHGIVKALLAPGEGKSRSIENDWYTIELRIENDQAIVTQWLAWWAEQGRGRRSLREVRQIIKRHLDGLPTGYEARRKHLIHLTDAVRQEIAAALEGPLNEHIAALPQGTYEEKKDLAKWVNAELRRFGLAIKAPKTGHPCLIVGTTGNRPEIGRFVFDYTDAQGQRQHPASFAELPKLELTLDDLTRAPYGGRTAAKSR